MGENARRKERIFLLSFLFFSFLGWSSLVWRGCGHHYLVGVCRSVVAPAGVPRFRPGPRAYQTERIERNTAVKEIPQTAGVRVENKYIGYGRTVIPVPRPIPSAFPSTSIAANPLFARPPLPPEIGKLFRFENRDSLSLLVSLFRLLFATKEEIN